MNKKKLLMILPHCSTGGMPQVAFKKIEILNKTNEFDIYVIEYSFIAAAYVVQRNKIKKILGEKFISLGENKSQILQIIEDIKPDIIHFEEIPEMFMSLNVANEIYKKDRNYFIVETTHDSSFDINNKIFLPDKFLFISNWSIKQFEPLGISMELAEYPLEISARPDRTEALKDLGLDPNKKHVLNVGLFTPRKNQGEIFEYAKLLPDIQFHFVGNQAENFKNYWEPLLNNKPNNCIIWGERSDTDKFYSSMDLFLFTSKGQNGDKETNPLVIKEALSWQMPLLLYPLDVYLGKYDNEEMVTYLTENLEKNVYLIKNILKTNKIEHFYKNILGWFDFEDLYSDVVKSLPNNSHIVEVGAFLGKSVSYLAVEANNSGKNIKIDVIDIWENSFAGVDGNLYENILKNLNDSFYNSFLKNIEPIKHLINPIKGNSENISKLYENNSLDFVFIDADHSYESVLNDILSWFPKVKENGILAGHDYNLEVVKKAVLKVFGNENSIEFYGLNSENTSWKIIKTKKIEKQIKINKLLSSFRMEYMEECNGVNLLNGLKDLCDKYLTSDMIMCEIGSYGGVSSELFANYVKELHCVDVWKEYGVGGLEQNKLTSAEERFDKLLTKYDNIKKVKMNSESGSKLYPDEYFDLVYIDADHSYESVINDIRYWLPKVKNGGILSGHDFYLDVEPAVRQWFPDPSLITTFSDSSWAIKKEKRKIGIFSHNYLIGNWRKVVEEQLYHLKECGLYDNADYIYYGYYSENKYNIKEFKKIIEEYDSSKKIILEQYFKNEFEYSTLLKVYEYSKENNYCDILYYHTKGVSPHLLQYNKKAIDVWRKQLIYYDFYKWEEIREHFKNNNFDTVGIMQFYHPNIPDFPLSYSGNFWWARGEYLRTLLNPFDFAYNYDNSELKRGYAEIWVTSGNRRWLNMWESMKDPYYDLFDEKDGLDLSHKVFNLFPIKDINKIWVDCCKYGIQQKETEFKYLLETLNNLSKKENILEIGFFDGGTSRGFCEIFKNVYSFDISPEKDIWKQLKQECPNWNYYTMDSHSIEMYQFIKSLNIKFDVIFIDGDHSYEGVKQDFEMYKEFLADNGIIIFHDIVDSERMRKHHNIFVSNFWKEIKNDYVYKEIIYKEYENINEELMGIGILYKSPTICVISPIKNEEKIISFYLDYYLNYIKVNKIIIYDGNSTDNTISIIKNWQSKYPEKIELIIQNHEKCDERELMWIRNESWKSFRNEYDWQIICDADEFLYHTNIKNILFEYKNNNITIPLISGYDMITDNFPTQVSGKFLPDLIKTGNYTPIWLNKNIIFNPRKVNINYDFGCHSCNPNGEIKYSQTSELKLLHYKWLSYEYIIQKTNYQYKRLANWSLENNMGVHNKYISETVTASDFHKNFLNSKQVITGRPYIMKYENIDGWFDFEDIYDFVIEKANNGEIFVELGAWLGKSTAYMAEAIKESGKNINFYTVDHFKGDPNIGNLKERFPNLKGETVHELYLENMGELTKNVKLLMMESEEASNQFEDNSCDFIFLDATKIYEDVKRDLNLWFPKIKSTGIFGGHDYFSWPGVSLAVDEFAKEHNLKVITKKSSWLLIPKDNTYKNDNKNYLSICLITKNSNEYIKEWVDYHIKAGVDHFYIFDDGSKVPLENILLPYINDNIITYKYLLIDKPSQVITYMNCLKDYKDKTFWMAFIDDDEFILSHHKPIKTLLKDYEMYGGLVINWVLFGSSGNKNKTKNVLENYLYRANYEIEYNKHIKTIVNTQYVNLDIIPITPHYFHYHNNSACNENKELVSDVSTFTHSVNKIQLNHYNLKSEEDYQEKINRSWPDAPHKFTMETFKELDDLCTIYDDEILKNKHIYVFNHNYLINNWYEIVDNQMKLIQDSELYDNVNQFFIFAYGSDENFLKFEKLITTYDYKNKFLIKRLENNNYEFDTLIELQKFSKNAPCNSLIFYYHTKGVTHYTNENINYWRNCLEYHTIIKWKTATTVLNNYDITGACYFDITKPAIFAGNFWWANSDYIKKLPLLNINEDRGSCENRWCSIPNKVYNLFNPQNWDLYNFTVINYKNEPLVSIIIPTYNRNESLKEAIESVINQTYKKWEILVCHGGPNEKTKEIIESYNNKNIKYYNTYQNQNDLGADQRNYITQNCNGEWILYLDDDNILYPNCIETLVNHINIDTGLIISKHHFNDAEHINLILPYENKLTPACYDFVTLLIKTEIAKKFVWDSNWGQDHRFFNNCENYILKNNLKIEYVSNILGNHRYLNRNEIERPIKIYTHYYLINNWKNIVKNQLDLLQSSELDKYCEHIYFNIAGNETEINEFNNLLNNYYTINKKSSILYVNNISEKDSLENLWNDIKKSNNVSYILYLHTKGVYSETLLENTGVASWRTAMEKFNISNWKECINKLKDNYDLTGIMRFKRETSGKDIFAGNFWWARSEYIKRLPKPEIIYDRFDMEDWVCQNPHRYYDFYPYKVRENNPYIFPIKINDNLCEKEDIFIVTSHPNYSATEEITYNCIKALKETGKKVILTTHCPVSKELQELSDYFIYDKNNIMILHSFFTRAWFDTDDYYSEINLTKNENNINHAPAVHNNYYNGIVLADKLGYKIAHCINFDLIIDKKDFQIFDNISNKIRTENKDGYFMYDEAIEGETYKTIYFAIKPKYFLENFGYFNTIEEYEKHIKNVGSNTNCLENVYFHTFKNK